MTQRHFPNWLTAFQDYSQWGEAPKRMYFWVGVSAIAGALQRKVWIDQAYFRWYPNQYIILVAPPGVVSKSTTANLSMQLLRRVPGIKFGSPIATWQSLIKEFNDATVGFNYGDEVHSMAALTLESSEFGNTLNTQDKQMVDLFTSLWDGKTISKSTKMFGIETVENPCINLLACTTPAWIADNIPEYMIGGGLISRMVFVYAEKKDKFIAYPAEDVPKDLAVVEQQLVDDLTRISELTGQFRFTQQALAYGRAWYEDVCTNRPLNLSDERFGGYLARKQTHLHKLAMALSASESDSLMLTEEHLALADYMLKDLEPDMAFVFSKVGRVDISFHAERLIRFVVERGRVSVMEAYKHVHPYFPKADDFQGILQGCLKSGYLRLIDEGSGMFLLPGNPLPSSSR